MVIEMVLMLAALLATGIEAAYVPTEGGGGEYLVRVEPDLVEFLMQLRLNDLVPPQLYAAVAEVIAWAHQVDGKVETPVREPENKKTV